MPSGERETAKTHCPQGHEYNTANTRINAGSRQCRVCDRDRAKAKLRRDGRIVIPTGLRTHCPRGHEYDEENTRRYRGMRFCRACDSTQRRMWISARYRANAKGIPFTITVEDIVIPECCPVLGMRLVLRTGRGSNNDSPSLDRINPRKGYVPGNVSVISYRANRIKNDASLEELRRITAWLESTLKDH